MQLSIENLSLPTHILQALQGELTAVNTISAPIPSKARIALNSSVLVVESNDSISAIESPYYEFDIHDANNLQYEIVE